MEVIEKRRSIRKYKSTPVKEELIKKLITSASLAPSGNNTQPWHFIIADDEVMKEKITAAAHNQQWMNSAPVFIICVADIRARVKTGEKIYLDEEYPSFDLKKIIRDTAISIEHLVLEATEQGLGTCWVAWYKQEEMRAVLGIPEDKFVVGIITVGYADEEPKKRPRKDIELMIHRNKW